MARPRSPDVAVARARLSGLHNGRGKNRPPDDPAVIAAREALKDANAKAVLADHVEKLVTNWPQLTDAQLDKIAGLLLAGGRSG